MSNTLSNIQSSLMKFCTDFMVTQQDLNFINFDAHADASTAPAGDLIGYSGLQMVFDEKLLDIKVMIGISTQGDTNIFRLNALMGGLLELLKPESMIRVYNSDTSEDIGWMKVQNGTRLLPVGGDDSRPLQYIMIGLSTSVNFQA